MKTIALCSVKCVLLARRQGRRRFAVTGIGYTALGQWSN